MEQGELKPFYLRHERGRRGINAEPRSSQRIAETERAGGFGRP
jgi:hypothetical protein